MTEIATSPPKPPEPEITEGPWDIADWFVKDVWSWPRCGGEGVLRCAVGVDARHRVTGVRRRHGVAMPPLSDHAAPRRATLGLGKDLLRAWVHDLNVAEREEPPA